MKLILFTLLIILERALGSSFIVLPLITVILFNLENNQLPKFSFLVGLIIDIIFGYHLGVSSILFLVSSFEVSWYKSKIESSNIWSIFLLGLLISVQAHIIWGIPASITKYLIHALTSMVIFLLLKNRSGKKHDGVYLRG
jgi:succinate dehydrogenase hydrophobic anchor subunit